MSISSEITRLQGAKADIKTAIEAKGVNVPSSAKLDAYDDYIGNISTGEEVSAGYFTNTNGSITFTQVGGTAEQVSSIYISDTGQAEPDYPASVHGIVFNGPCATATSVQVIPSTFTSGMTDFSNMFRYYSALTTVPLFDTSSGTEFAYMFFNCSALTTVPLFDTSSGTNFSVMFDGCSALTTVPLFDTSSGTNFRNMFHNCSALTTVPQLDTSRGTAFSGMFQNCSALTSVPQLNTSSGTILGGMFYNCSALTTIPQLDASMVSGIMSNLTNMFYGCSALTNFGGLLNCKKSYSLSDSPLLTHDSLMNAINGLFDLTGQTSQKLTIGSTNLAKLTAEDIAIATGKNWTLA